MVFSILGRNTSVKQFQPVKHTIEEDLLMHKAWIYEKVWKRTSWTKAEEQKDSLGDMDWRRTHHKKEQCVSTRQHHWTKELNKYSWDYNIISGTMFRILHLSFRTIEISEGLYGCRCLFSYVSISDFLYITKRKHWFHKKNIKVPN